MCWTKYSLEKTQPRETGHFASVMIEEKLLCYLWVQILSMEALY